MKKENSEDIEDVLNEKRINMPPEELLKVLNMDMEKSNEAVKVLKGYNPYSEFDME